MELAGAAIRRSLPSASPAVARGRTRGRRIPARVACVRGGFAEEGHLRYYEAGASPRKAATVTKDYLSRLRATGLVAGDASKEKALAEATDLLLQELNQMKDEECSMKKVQKEEKAAMKALKKQQQKEAEKAAAGVGCEDGSSSESSESDCEGEQIMKIEQGTVISISTAASEVGASGVSTISQMECDMAAMKAIKKMEKERKKAAAKAMKKMEKEQKKAAKKAMKKMDKEAKKVAMAALNVCRDEDSSCSSESSESECEGEVVRMSRCATIIAPQQPTPTTVFPIIVPQIPESVPLQPSQEPRISSEPPASAMQCASIAVVEKPTANRIEVCMGGKCRKSGALGLLQEFEKEVGAGGATVVGCKCLGKCGLGPNVRLRSSEGSADGSVKKNPLYIGVGLEDVGTIVTGLFGDGDLGVTPA